MRKLAHDLGIDLTSLVGTGEDGLITRDDVRACRGTGAHRSRARRDARRERARETPHPHPRRPQAHRRGDGGERVHRAARERVPHGRRHPDDGAASRSSSATRAFAGLRVNLLTVVAKALCIAVGAQPVASTRAGTRRRRRSSQYGYVNLGIAAATPRGLVVPNIKDADRHDRSRSWRRRSSGLVETARAGTTSPADLGGGTISITNIGVFGVDAGTPILNPGEAAILAMGAVRRQPWEYHGEIALRR